MLVVTVGFFSLKLWFYIQGNFDEIFYYFTGYDTNLIGSRIKGLDKGILFPIMLQSKEILEGILFIEKSSQIKPAEQETQHRSKSGLLVRYVWNVDCLKIFGIFGNIYVFRSHFYHVR